MPEDGIKEWKEKQREIKFKLLMITMSIHFFSNNILIAREMKDKEQERALMFAMQNARELGAELTHELKNVDSMIQLTEAAYSNKKTEMKN